MTSYDDRYSDDPAKVEIALKAEQASIKEYYVYEEEKRKIRDSQSVGSTETETYTGGGGSNRTFDLIGAFLLGGPGALLCMWLFETRVWRGAEKLWGKLLGAIAIISIPVLILPRLLTGEPLDYVLLSSLCVIPIALVVLFILIFVPRFFIGMLVSVPWGMFLGGVIVILTKGTATVFDGAVIGGIIAGLLGGLDIAKVSGYSSTLSG